MPASLASAARRVGALAIISAGAFGIGASADAAPTAAAAHDLAVGYSSSMLKAPGFAGDVSIRVSNAGSDRYVTDYGTARFTVKVHTVSGPEGVDRIITAHGKHGSTVHDLGFDEATSTRTFEVILSNPIEKGADVEVARLSFGDGLTSEGRVVQSIETTQTARLDDDATTGNDQDVDSRGHTRSGVGTQLDGTF